MTGTKDERRTKGTGTVYQSSSGKWVAQATLQGKRKAISCATKREAETKLREMLSDADKGIILASGKAKVGEWLTEWIETKPKLRPETRKSYALIIRVHLAPALGHIKLSDLQRAHLRSLYGELAAKGLKASTIHRIHAIVSSALQDALDDDLIPRNIARGMELDSIERDEMQTLDPQQVRTLLDAASGSHYHALLTLAIYSGMRIGELLALQWGDVDFERGMVRVNRSLTRSKTFGEPKSAKSKRTISLPPACMDVLRAHRVEQIKERLKWGDQWQDNNLAFCTMQAGNCKSAQTLPGSPLTARVVTRAFESLLERAGLPKVRFHDLRHTAATLMLLSGVPIKVASARLGHSTSALTMDVYSHVLPEMDREAADKVGRLLA
ncbi:MAG: site-specific integrase [Chloroflexota bacterium]|nr:site-specific integrase [Chloroflexota bacterium]